MCVETIRTRHSFCKLNTIVGLFCKRTCLNRALFHVMLQEDIWRYWNWALFRCNTKSPIYYVEKSPFQIWPRLFSKLWKGIRTYCLPNPAFPLSRAQNIYVLKFELDCFSVYESNVLSRILHFLSRTLILSRAFFFAHVFDLVYLLNLCVRQKFSTNWEDTGWRRPIGYLRLQVIFHNRATNYWALLRKMTCKGKTSCGSSPPCGLD